MNPLEAYSDLTRFGKFIVSTRDVALRLQVGTDRACRTLGNLQRVGLVTKLCHGLWALSNKVDPLAVPTYITAPMPAYISFQSALYFREMISQIPQVIYVASLGAPQEIKTSVGHYSVHRLAPELFGGYEETAPNVLLATAEKALVDTLYLTNSRSHLFGGLPELELPETFDWASVEKWVAKIGDPRRKGMVMERLKPFRS